ncbi:MAG: cytochrome c biogenesis protein CcsA [Deltaproteobacteria bacterium]|jgi:ABC-type transport system involved in cytochrome c biogenesis permease subunit|nr:cytochrome c biogenesis protein CcsA [Deltaproteobacteria bacterium]
MTEALSVLAGGLLAVSFVIQSINCFRQNAPYSKLSPWLALGSALLLLVSIVLRSIEISYIALTGTFEALIFFAAIIAALVGAYGLQTRLPKSKDIGLAVTLVAIVIVVVANTSLSAKQALAPIPALRSSWLVLHVSLAFIGEAFFAISFVAAILTLLTKDAKKQLAHEELTYRCIAIGYPFFTVGALIFGSIWAQTAWGRWWGWDPKETWALVTWIIYTVYLHLRLMGKKVGRKTAIVAAAGFLLAMFTLLAVNYLMDGLHSY